jgi:hypothetical protein
MSAAGLLRPELHDPDEVALRVVEPRSAVGPELGDAVDDLQAGHVVLEEDDPERRSAATSPATAIGKLHRCPSPTERCAEPT